VGAIVGSNDGMQVGFKDDAPVGTVLGRDEGKRERKLVGSNDGNTVETGVGFQDGVAVGTVLGSDEGYAVGT
jgi:hypothetical protein